MKLPVNRIINFFRRAVKYRLHPRAIIWKYWQKHNPQKPVITRLTDNLRVRVYPHDIIGKYIYIDGAYEPDSLNFVKKFLKKGMTVFDLGANLGQYTLLTAKIVGNSGHVHSFEPGSRMFKELEFNVSLNQLSETVTLNNVAVSDVSGKAKLTKYRPGSEVFASLGSHVRQEADAVGYEEVETVTLDSYMAVHKINKVDFMKIDIEGAELMALKGADKLLSGDDAPVIIIELADINTVGFGYKALDIYRYLETLGYKMYLINSGRYTPVAESPRDFSIACDMIATKSTQLI